VFNKKEMVMLKQQSGFSLSQILLWMLVIVNSIGLAYLYYAHNKPIDSEIPKND